ncbi:MAG TPA: PIN/TRAM domain-containing protein [Allocoleopsis sp.]
MIDTIIILLFIFGAAIFGFDSIDLLPKVVKHNVTNPQALRLVTATFFAIIGGAFGLTVQTAYRRIEKQIQQLPPEEIFTRSVGLIIGLIIANLMLTPIYILPIGSEFSVIKPLTAVLGSVMMGFLGMTLTETHGRSLLRFINPNSVESILVAEGTLKATTTKVLDTSCIIDGRIEPLLATGFMEGQIIIPQFILQELQQLADASNDTKRTRGRRGLDMLNRLKETFTDRIVINSIDYEDMTTVDAKLVRFTQEINGVLMTNDYNLSKVALLQKVFVLNINDLAQAVRPIYLPGDTLDLKILKEGKEQSQGIGYLDDGTMVVVEEGKKYVGVELRVVVTSALQTSAGRMIFARTQGTFAGAN